MKEAASPREFFWLGQIRSPATELDQGAKAEIKIKIKNYRKSAECREISVQIKRTIGKNSRKIKRRVWWW